MGRANGDGFGAIHSFIVSPSVMPSWEPLCLITTSLLGLHGIVTICVPMCVLLSWSLFSRDSVRSPENSWKKSRASDSPLIETSQKVLQISCKRCVCFLPQDVQDASGQCLWLLYLIMCSWHFPLHFWTFFLFLGYFIPLSSLWQINIHCVDVCSNRGVFTFPDPVPPPPSLLLLSWSWRLFSSCR